MDFAILEAITSMHLEQVLHREARLKWILKYMDSTLCKALPVHHKGSQIAGSVLYSERHSAAHFYHHDHNSSIEHPLLAKAELAEQS